MENKTPNRNVPWTYVNDPTDRNTLDKRPPTSASVTENNAKYFLNFSRWTNRFRRWYASIFINTFKN